MTSNASYRSDVASCFDDETNVSACDLLFYRGDTDHMSHWKDAAVSDGLKLIDKLLLEREKKSKSHSHKDDDDDDDDENIYDSDNSDWELHRVTVQPNNRDELTRFVKALPSCIPLFGHLYCNQQQTQRSRHCWCPCSKSLSGWWRNNGLDFMSGTQCEHDLPVTRQSIHRHYNFFNSEKNCTFHCLAHSFLKSYQSHFKKGLNSEYSRQLNTNVISSSTINTNHQFKAPSLINIIHSNVTSTSQVMINDASSEHTNLSIKKSEINNKEIKPPPTISIKSKKNLLQNRIVFGARDKIVKVVFTFTINLNEIAQHIQLLLIMILVTTLISLVCAMNHLILILIHLYLATRHIMRWNIC